MGAWLGGLAQRDGSHPVHVFPAGRRAGMPAGDGRDHVWSGAAGDVYPGRGKRIRSGLDRRPERRGDLRRCIPPERGGAIDLQFRESRYTRPVRRVRQCRKVGAPPGRRRPAVARIRPGAQGFTHLQSARRTTGHIRDRTTALHSAHSRPVPNGCGSLLRPTRIARLSGRQRPKGCGMSKTISNTLLIELGCEELPAKSLVRQAEMLASGMHKQLADAGLKDAGSRLRWLATPRRLAILAEGVAQRQPDRKLERKGPAEKAAFDDAGNPTRAAEGFARSVGLAVDQLERLENEQGRWLYAEIEEPGKSLAELLPQMLDKVVRDMAGARSMRWSDRSDRFLRPARWLVVLHGSEVLPVSILGLEAGRDTRGHRIHAPGAHAIEKAGDYEALLRQAYVVADYAGRRNQIAEQVKACADSAGLQTLAETALLDEVTGLVEWPVAVVGSFDEAFLEVPAEALAARCANTRSHSRCSPVMGSWRHASLPWPISRASSLN